MGNCQNKDDRSSGQQRPVRPHAVGSYILLIGAIQSLPFQVTPQVPAPGMGWVMRNIVVDARWSGKPSFTQALCGCSVAMRLQFGRSFWLLFSLHSGLLCCTSLPRQENVYNKSRNIETQPIPHS